MVVFALAIAFDAPRPMRRTLHIKQIHFWSERTLQGKCSDDVCTTGIDHDKRLGTDRVHVVGPTSTIAFGIFYPATGILSNRPASQFHGYDNERCLRSVFIRIVTLLHGLEIKC